MGSKDLQVPPEQNLPKVREALAMAGNTDVTIVKLKGLNHLFPTCRTGSSLQYFALEETSHEPSIARIRDWALARTESWSAQATQASEASDHADRQARWSQPCDPLRPLFGRGWTYGFHSASGGQVGHGEE